MHSDRRARDDESTASQSTAAKFVNAVEDATAGNQGRSPREQLAFERRREREFYRYYGPFQALSQVPQSKCDLNDTQSVRSHLARSSPDKALTAFTQLAALRLRTRRAMLFFFDADYAYILAEATRSLSLQDDTRHEVNDELWLGTTRIPRGFSVCEHTVNLCPPNAGEVHIVPDLSEDTRFCDRPYVTDGPKARFYAGVPITTARGINIGAFCVLHDERREGLSDGETLFLQEMATTVMTHLEMVRAKALNQRSRDMTVGMSAFIDGQSTVHDWLSLKQKGKRHLNEDGSTEVAPSDLATPGDETQGTVTNHAPLNKDKPGIARQARSRATLKRSKHSRKNTTRSAKIKESKAPNERAQNGGVDQLAEGAAGAYSRAAVLLQEALDADGVQILDATVGTFGGLVDAAAAAGNAGPFLSGDDAISLSSASESECLPDLRREARFPLKHCKILGRALSVRQEDMLDNREESEGVCTEKFLSYLLRYYPNGHIWNFTDEGDVTSESFSEREPGMAADASMSAERERQLRKKDASVREHRRLQAMFPAARSLLLSGMWDSYRGKWAAATIAWTNSPMRIFSNDLELNYMAAFGDVIVADVTRLNALAMDQAKTDFLSSISHELRSPLHGILGNVENLQEQQMDADFTTWETIRSIESCGASLLDVINQLLEYTEVNVKGTRSVQSARLDHQEPNRRDSEEMQVSDAVGSLDELLEDVLETAVAGTQQSKHSLRDQSSYRDRNPSSPLNSDSKQVDFALNISDAPTWCMKIDGGKFRQIALNLVSNALKYTDVGSVHVEMHSEPALIDDPTSRRIILSVTDTGIGMSTDFVANNLFHPFQQENTLSQGTGLGLTLVAKTVRSLGGIIQVDSHQGQGTKIIVTLTLDTVSGTTSRTRNKYSGQKFGLVSWPSALYPDEQSTSRRRARKVILGSLESNIKATGLKPCYSEEYFPDDASLVAVVEDDLQNLRLSNDGSVPLQSLGEGPTTMPTIVLCRNIQSARQLEASYGPEEAGRNLVFAAQPIGPAKLSKLLEYCLGDSPPAHQLRRPPIPPSVSFPATLSAPATEAPVEIGPLHPLIEQNESPNRRGRVNTLTSKERRKESSPTPSSSKTQIAERPKPLPQATAGKHARPQPPSRQFTTNAGPEPSLSLLLVDDNPVNLRILTMYAKRSAHSYVAAENGQEAVDAYEAAILPLTQEPAQTASAPAKPRAVLMDINMPILDGFAATRAIRALERKTGVEPATVIALTGLGAAEDRKEAFASGVDLFLTKPIKLKELHKILAGVAERDAGIGGNREKGV